jgi:hypothetical protein
VLLWKVESQAFNTNLVINGTADLLPPPPASQTYIWPSSWQKASCSWKNTEWNCNSPNSCACTSPTIPAVKPPHFFPDLSTQATLDGCEISQTVDVSEYHQTINSGSQVFRLTFSASQFYVTYRYNSVDYVDTSSSYHAVLEYYGNSNLLSSFTTELFQRFYGVESYNSLSSCTSPGNCFSACLYNWLTHYSDVVPPVGTDSIKIRLFANIGENAFSTDRMLVYIAFDGIIFSAQTPPPINCQWGDWGTWSECNSTCGGYSTRNRTVVIPAVYGGTCTGASSETKACSPCPVNCSWNTWSDWSNCSLPCGSGVQQRSRTQNPEINGGAPCDGNSVEYSSCNTNPCPIDCVWDNWQPWTDCSAPCAGKRNRTRSKFQPELYGGKPCSGVSVQSEPCNPCEDCVWDAWSAWTLCTSCNQLRYRTRREKISAVGGGRPCEGADIVYQPCICAFEGSIVYPELNLTVKIENNQAVINRESGRINGGLSLKEGLLNFWLGIFLIGFLTFL